MSRVVTNVRSKFLSAAGLGASVFAISVIAWSITASAQSCDERFALSCQRNVGPRWEPLPPSGPFAPRVIAPSPDLSPPSDIVAPRDTAAPRELAPAALDPGLRGSYAAIYGRVDGEPFSIPAVKLSEIGAEFLRRAVYYPSNEPPGTIVIDPQRHFLYLVQGGGRALRYGVGVGRQGFGWSGVATVHEKREWPDWYPPKEMLARQPELRRQMSELQSGIGMPGGPRNPLGARAMYLWQGNKDTLYRIHGTVEPWTIGTSVSSGCIRMINQDAIDLYQRAPIGARVVVLPSSVS
jgi:lipoprotein-anchoring transpeptidase ErfK/SrfK